MGALLGELLSRTSETEFIFGLFHLLLACLTLLVLVSWFRREPKPVERPAHILLIGGFTAFAIEFILAAVYSGAEFFFLRGWNRLPADDWSHAMAATASLLISAGLVASVSEVRRRTIFAGAILAGPAIASLLLSPVPLHSGGHTTGMLGGDIVAFAMAATGTVLLARRRVSWRQPPRLALSLLLASIIVHLVQVPTRSLWSGPLWHAEQHLLSFSLFAFAWALGERSTNLFDRVFVRLNLTFIILASVMMLSTVGMQRFQFLKLAQERSISLGEYLRSHLVYWLARGADLQAALENRDALRQIVVGFGELPDLRRIDVQLGDRRAMFLYSADRIVSHEFGLTSQRTDAAAERKLFRMMSLPVFPENQAGGRIDLYGSTESINRHLGTYIVLIYLLFTVMVTASVILVGIIVRNADRAIQKQTSEIGEIQRQLAQASKLASIGELAGGVAHEINNPVTSILSTATHMVQKRGASLPERDRQELTLIAEQAERISGIVTKLLTFSRQSRMEFGLVDLNEVVETALSLLEFRFQNSPVRVQCELAEDLPLVLGDANRLIEVFVNLMNNALDAMPGGGTLTLRTSPGEDGSVRCVITDTGCGIDPALAGRIFDPFFTTKEPGKGTGLGLSISHGIIKDHRGEIQVESTAGHGSTFTVLLPRGVPFHVEANPDRG